MEKERCPKCATVLEYDEVDIGVGVQRGNYYCQECGWSPRIGTDESYENHDSHDDDEV